jgi:hypothetical protein
VIFMSPNDLHNMIEKYTLLLNDQRWFCSTKSNRGG